MPATSMRTSAVAPCCWDPTQADRPSALSVPLCACATGTRPTTRSVAVSRNRASLAPHADTSTQLPSGAMARPCGFGPTSTVATTRSLAVSITLTVESPSLDT